MFESGPGGGKLDSDWIPHRFGVNFTSLLAKIEATKTSRFKFQLINYLNCLLSSKPIQNVLLHSTELNEATSSRVYAIMEELFKSKQETQLGFYLLRHFIDLFQFECIYMKDRRFFYFLIHLMCIQTALNLEKAADPSALAEVDFSLMTIYYQLLEDVIIILSTASPFEDDEDDDDEEEEEEDEDENSSDDEDYQKSTANKNVSIVYIQKLNH